MFFMLLLTCGNPVYMSYAERSEVMGPKGKKLIKETLHEEQFLLREVPRLFTSERVNLFRELKVFLLS